MGLNRGFGLSAEGFGRVGPKVGLVMPGTSTKGWVSNGQPPRAGPGFRTGRGLPFGSPVGIQLTSPFYVGSRQLSAAEPKGCWIGHSAAEGQQLRKERAKAAGTDTNHQGCGQGELERHRWVQIEVGGWLQINTSTTEEEQSKLIRVRAY